MDTIRRIRSWLPPAVLAGVLLAGVASPLPAADPPAMGEEIPLDPGYRYPILECNALTAQILIVDSTIVYLYRDSDYRLVGCRRTLAGEEIDVGIREIVSPEVGAYFVSGPDSLGWKVVYRESDAHPASLWIRNFDARTLGGASEPRLVAGKDVILNPQIAMGEGFHVIGWIDGWRSDSLYIRRIDAEMNFIDPEPLPIAPIRGGLLALRMRSDGGAIVYLDRQRRLRFQHLGRDGSPSGTPTILDNSVSSGGWAALDSYGSGWLLAWRGGYDLKVAWLDSTGAVEAPILHRVTEGDCRTLAVCAHDSIGFVLWKEGGGSNLLGTLVRRGEESMADPILLDDTTVNWDWEDRDPKTAACAWTGDSFAAFWLGYVSPETVNPAPTSFWDPFPVQGQWIAMDGSLRYPKPIYIAQRSSPYFCTPIRSGDGYLAFLDNLGDYWTGDNWYHVVPLDSLGMPQGDPLWYDLPQVEDDCAWQCTSSFTRGVATHPWAGGVAAAHMKNDHYSSYIGTCINSHALFIDRIDANAERTLRHGIPIFNGCYPSDALKAYDASARGDSLLLAWTLGGAQTDRGQLRLLHASGTTLRDWSIRSDSAVTTIAVAPTESGWVSVWSQGAGGGTMRLRKATIDPDDPANTLTGDWLLPEPFAAPGTVRLIPGPRRILCLFPAKMGEEYDIFFVRLDSTGALLDEDPVRLCGLPGDQGSIEGVWDGNHYFATYVSRVETDRTTYGNRVGANGQVIDGDGFLIASDSWDPARAASDGRGHVVLGWGNRVVRIDDLIPLADDDDDTAPDDTTGDGGDDTAPEDSTEVPVDPPPDRIAGLISHPSKGEIRLAGPLPGGGMGTACVMDVNGRVVAIETLQAGAEEHPLVWRGRLSDGRRAPTGFYIIRIEAGGMKAIRRVLLLR